MSLHNRVILPIVALTSLAFLVACGSSSNKATAPPTGGFTNANFNGTYVFSFSGSDYTDASALEDYGTFFAVAGTLTATPASGSTTKGSLSGTIDVNDPQLAAAIYSQKSTTISNVMPGLAATGSYSITVDGRGSGSITVNIPVGSSTVQYTFGLDFVMSSTQHGLIIRFDQTGNGTGSGTIDMQTSGVTQSALEGSYSFALYGVDDSGDPLGTVGSVTLNSSGGVTSGLQDFNDNGDTSSLTALNLQSSSIVLVGSPGTARLATSASFGSLDFDVWVIDSTHLKLIETDGTAVLVGDAYVSTGQSFPTGNLVYTMSGVDNGGGVVANEGPLAIGGSLNANSGSISSGLEDYNDAGTVAQPPSVSGNYATTNGRTLLTLSGFYNGGWNDETYGTYTFAAYPFSYGTGGVGVVLLEIDNGSGGITGGTAYLQSTTSLAASTSSQGYGLNLSGDNTSGEVDMIAEFTATSSDITGLYDVNNAGATIFDYWFGDTNKPGTYTVGSGGRGTAQVPLQTNNSLSVIGDLDVTFYTVDDSNAIFIETDTDQVATGAFQLQTASENPALALPYFSMARAGNAHAGNAAGAMKAHQKK